MHKKRSEHRLDLLNADFERDETPGERRSHNRCKEGADSHRQQQPRLAQLAWRVSRKRDLLAPRSYRIGANATNVIVASSTAATMPPMPAVY